MEEALASLRDIHVPPPVSWWPPAIGYWLIAALMIGLLVFLLVRRRRFRMRRIAEAELAILVRAHAEHKNDQKLAQDVSVLLRRVAITLGARERTAGITGEQWIETLHKMVEPATYRFSDDAIEALSRAIYQPTAPVAVDELISNCRQWIRLLPPQKARS